MFEFLAPYFSELNYKILLAIGVGGSSVSAALWTLMLFFHKAITEREQRQFDRYRLLIKNLNIGEDGGAPIIDVQMDSVYQMRYFRRFYPRSLWMLNRLRLRWMELDKGRSKPLYGRGHIEEIEETIEYISHRITRLGAIIYFFIDGYPIFIRKKTALKKIRITP